MTNSWPRFRIFIVRDGQAYGLLIKRRESDYGPEEARYFWLRKADGLAPTQEVVGACSRCHELLPSVYNQRFVCLLAGYSEAVARAGNLQINTDLVSKHLFEREVVPLAVGIRLAAG